MPPAPSILARLVSDARTWCIGRLWIIRLPVLAYFVFVWVAHTTDPLHQSLFKGIDLGIHELGHVLFHPLGDVVGALGGSILQCTAPLLAAVMFIRQRDYFAISFCFGWLSANLFEVATYAGDAVAKSLHLVTPGGGEPIHDWNYVLATLGWLRHTEEIAALHRIFAHAAMIGCLAFGGWLVLTMVRSAKHSEAHAPVSSPTSTGTRSPRG